MTPYPKVRKSSLDSLPGTLLEPLSTPHCLSASTLAESFPPSLPQDLKSEGRPSGHGVSEASGTVGRRKGSDSKIHENLIKEKGKRRMWDTLRV